MKKTIDFFRNLCYNKTMIRIAIHNQKTVILSGSESKFTETLLNMFSVLNMQVLCLEAKPMEEMDSQQQTVSSVAGK